MAAETVTIGCRIVNGVTLDIQDGTSMGEATAGTIRGNLPAPVVMKSIKLNGANKGTIAIASADTRLIGSIGYTQVAKADWDMWKEQNFNSPLMNQKHPEHSMLFEAKNDNEAQAKGKAVQSTPTGNEGVDPKKGNNVTRNAGVQQAQNVQRTK